MTDLELAIFLHSNYYDLEKTKVCIDKYFTIRTDMPEVFGNRDVLQAVNAEQGKFAMFAELPQRHKGNRIVALALQPVDDLSSMVSSRLAFMGLAMMDVLIRNWPICPGYVFIMDARNLRFGHIFKTSISMLRKIAIYTQEAEPIRMKEVHVINMNYLGEKILFLLKPFLGKELQKVLHFHSGAMEAFYEAFPKDVLPQEFGGTSGLLLDYHSQSKSIAVRIYFKN
ncbi:hypothetical protein R5R35_014034 [Gryllus longicercus]|uniref:CRAL-TRIO domain-containing protein n=1 Tax=Gryllus longicercus TaxID=2509291 RepID=A0AAN9ZEE7_9ORTH